MNLYGVTFSPYCARALLAARFKGIKLPIALPEGGFRSPAYLKINPLGKVPALKDGKTIVFESGIIVEYLEAKSKKKPLVPKNAKAAAQARMIGSVFGDYVQGALAKTFAHLGPDCDKAAVDAIMADMNRYLDIAEDLIAAKPYAAGAKFTIADVYAIPTLALASVLLPAFFDIKDFIGKRKKIARYMAKAKKDKVIGPLMKEIEASFNTWKANRKG